jgi:hypothetical protein
MKSLSRLMTPKQLTQAKIRIDTWTPQPRSDGLLNEEEASNVITP